jgi:hypothetical protein
MLPVAKGVSAPRDGCGFDLISQAFPFGRLWYGQAEDAGNLMCTNQKLVQTTKHLKFHHSVYVVLLDNAVGKHRSILHASPSSEITLDRLAPPPPLLGPFLRLIAGPGPRQRLADSEDSSGSYGVGPKRFRFLNAE